MWSKTLFLYLAWLVAILGTFGSLYFGEGAGLSPCPLCWYQRVCLFPLSFVLGVAVYQNFTRIWEFVIYQVLAGMFFATYQLLQDYMPGTHIFCGKEKACISKDAIWNIPFAFLSLLAFSCILGCLFLARIFETKENL